MKKDLWQRAEELFHAALERPPEARQAFLDEACRRDAELRRQVEILISKDEEAGTFLEKPALADMAGSPRIGQTISHYRIVEKLGQGGMGEVYRAHDSKLGRDVAIKTLPSEFAADPERVARFHREARLLASLNHPNIAAIHELEKFDGTQFLVLELVEGDTLADQLKRGPIPGEDSLKLALQIAEALEAAHEKGVIHRDLKPANIKVTPEGKVKVLDFGLAKAFAGEQAEVNLSNSPTLSSSETLKGVILGTAAYMSPEQARGKPVDKRADIWSFGCVLFEMLTGNAAFSGDDVSDILAAVIRAEPDWKKLPSNLHWRIRELLARCLEKEAGNRYSGIGDARVEIQKTLADPNSMLVHPATKVESRTRLRKIAPWIAAGAILGLLIGAAAMWEFKPAEPRQVTSFDYDLPANQQFSDLGYKTIAVSPDGRQIVYCTTNGLYIRSAGELTARLVPGTEGPASNPFFSPDGKWIGFWSGTAGGAKLKKIFINGGAPVVLCEVVNILGAWWNEDDTIVFGQFTRDLMRISAKGGTPESIIKAETEYPSAPQILPDGKTILYTSAPNNGQGKIMVRSLKSGEARELFAGYDAQYLPTGHIVYRLPNSNNLFAIPFNLERLEVNGEAVSVLEGVVQYAISKSGTLAYIPDSSGGTANQKSLVWVDHEGKEESLSAPPKDYLFFRISPDEKQVTLQAMADQYYNIWIWDDVGKSLTRLTLDESSSSLIPLWTLDGKRIVYALNRENTFGPGDIYSRAADGTGGIERLASVPGRGLFPWSWSKDEKLLALWEFTLSPMQSDIGLLSMAGDHVRKPLLQGKYWEKDPRISHDGRWMAYASNESGKYEVYVRPFPEVNTGQWKVSTDGGNSPLWSPDDRVLFYRSGEAAMAVAVQTKPIFKKLGVPTVLFRGKFPGRRGVDSTDIAYWDISPKGKRFLMLKDVAESLRKINVVMNWFEELKRQVPKK